MDDVMLNLSILSFRIVPGGVITNEDTRDGFRRIVHTAKRVLSKISQANPVTIDRAALSHILELLLIFF